MSERHDNDYRHQPTYNNNNNNNIDPRLLLLDQRLLSGRQIYYGQPNDLANIPSAQEFAREVEQAIHPQITPERHDFLDEAQSALTNREIRSSSLNPRATPFYPPVSPNRSAHHEVFDANHNQTLLQQQNDLPHSNWNNQLQQFQPCFWRGEEPECQPNQPGLNVSEQQRGGLNANASPFFQHIAPDTEHRNAFLHAIPSQWQNVDPATIERLAAIAIARTSNQGPTHAEQDAAMTVTSENISRLQNEANSTRATTEWNQSSYQYPVEIPVQPQFPPTPASSSRHRRGGSVALSVSSTRSGVQSCQCTECGQTFASRYKLNHHRRWHKKDFPCDLCEKAFSAQKDVNRHLKTVHKLGDKEYFCPITECHYHREGFYRLDHLKKHNQRMHPRNPWSPPATSSGGGG